MIRAIVLLALVAVVVAGCSNSNRGTTTTSAHSKGVRFAECMRTNGVRAFPDPAASGAFTVDGVVNGSSLDPNSAAWKNAITACRSLQPPGFTGSKPTPEQLKVRLEFAQCVRDNGVRDFPDPTPSGPLVDTNRIPSAATPSGLSLLNAALHRCSGYAAKLGITRG
jgi:hypothetical protein